MMWRPPTPENSKVDITQGNACFLPVADDRLNSNDIKMEKASTNIEWAKFSKFPLHLYRNNASIPKMRKVPGRHFSLQKFLNLSWPCRQV